MASTYVNDLRLNELATGDGSGTWGTTTNTNLELIAEGLSFGTEGITTNADTHTSTVADGSTDPARSMFIKYTGTLDSACTITIAPNTISRVHFIENGTSGSQNIIIKQGSGATVTIAPGDVKVVYLDGAGSGAAVVDAFASLSVAVLNASDACTITTADNTTQLTLTSTDADASEGPRLDLRRNSASPADDDVLGTIRYLGENSADENIVYGEIEAQVKDVTDGTEDSELRFFVRRAGDLKEAMMLGQSSVVFNEGSADMDFRVESDAQTNCFFINGGTSNVGINGAPANELDVLANDTNGDATIRVLAGTDSASVAAMNITTQATAGDRESRLAFGDAANANIGKIAYHHDDDSMRFTTNAAERMRLTANTFTMFNGASAKLLFQRDDTTTIGGNPLGAIEFSHTDSTDAGTAAKILGEGDGSSGEGRITFHTGTPSSLNEEMRLDNLGRLCLGTTSVFNSAVFSIKPKTTNRIVDIRSFNTDAQHHILFQNNSGNSVGTITCTTTATSYNTSSDYRLKTAVTYDWDATSRLKQLKPARFKWISDGDNAVFVDGFLAHECGAVPEAISGTKDAMMDEEYEVSAEEKDADGNVTKEAVMGTRSVPDYQGIDQSKLVPLLVKTILELEARITALESA